MLCEALSSSACSAVSFTALHVAHQGLPSQIQGRRDWLCGVYIGITENNMETTIVYRVILI